MKSKRFLNIISCVVFSILLVAAIVKCADVLEYKEAREKYIPFYESETNFDVIFLGTSHMWNHVLPMELWDEYGIASYNWGYSNCTPAENYYLIQDILKYTSPKVVVIDLYGLTEYEGYNNGKYRTDEIEQQHVQFDSLPIYSLNKYKASQDVFDDYAHNEDFIWNFIMYHNRWNELGKKDFEYDITTEKGARFLVSLGETVFSPIPEDKKIEIDSACYPYYLKIIEYCQEQGIQVLCVCIPHAASENLQKVANTIGDIVEEYPNCSYINMLRKNILNFSTDVCKDKEHLNYSGAAKVTTWLGQYLTDHYELDDYSQNDAWIKDYENYYEYKVNKLKSGTSLASYLVQLQDDDFVVDAEVYDTNLQRSDRLKLLFDNAGISPIYVESDTENCISLTVKSALTGELVEKADFICDDIEDPEISSIVKVTE